MVYYCSWPDITAFTLFFADVADFNPLIIRDSKGLKAWMIALVLCAVWPWSMLFWAWWSHLAGLNFQRCLATAIHPDCF